MHPQLRLLRGANRPATGDTEEPERVAAAVVRLGLRHAVITSVTRDDLADGGAAIFAATIQAIRRQAPKCSVEVLIPDFMGSREALQEVMDARPTILNHNLETVASLQRSVRPQADYQRSLAVLRMAREMAPDALTKSGIMLGLGEEWDEILETMADLRAVECSILTLGQYLRPSLEHLPIRRYYEPEEFATLREKGLAMGFTHVEAAPLVRSSIMPRSRRRPPGRQVARSLIGERRMEAGLAICDASTARLLSQVQRAFPLDARPFAALGEALGLPEEQLLARISELKAQRIIRQISGIFDSRRLGYQSCLVAAQDHHASWSKPPRPSTAIQE